MIHDVLTMTRYQKHLCYEMIACDRIPKLKIHELRADFVADCHCLRSIQRSRSKKSTA